MTNLDILYETLREWRDRFPSTVEILSVSILYDGHLLITIDWTNNHRSIFSASEEEINSAYGLEEIGERILSEMERQYRVWEVGEE